MLKGESIIYFSSDEWDSGLKTSQYHMAVRLARENRVLYVNSIGLRRPTASKGDALRILNKLQRWFAGVREVRENLFVCTPIIIPFHSIPAVRVLNRLLLVGYLRYLQWRLGLKAPILWTFLPNIADIPGSFNEKKVIYYCADQVSSFKGVDAPAIRDMEKKLLGKADLVFATSQSLYEEKSHLNKNTFYLPHGVDVELFNKALSASTLVPADIAALKKPVIGFFGLVSGDWIDFDLLNGMADKHPEWSVVLIGKYTGEAQALLRRENIHLFGPRPYELLPAYCKAFDVAIIPFVLSELTRNSNPLKLKEYLAAGVPVVSTELPELERYRGLIEIGGDHEGFTAAVEGSLRQESRKMRAARSAAVKDDSWEARYETVSGLAAVRGG